jgi:hypothetical protein
MDSDWIEVTVTPRMGEAEIEAEIARAFRRFERADPRAFPTAQPSVRSDTGPPRSFGSPLTPRVNPKYRRKQMDSPDKTPHPPGSEVEAVAEEPGNGITRGSLLARAGVVAGGAALAASPLGLDLLRPRAAFAQDNEIEPPPPSIGADVPVTYFGPSPSQVDKRLVGPVQLLRSGVLDLENLTITLPLYKGRVGGGGGDDDRPQSSGKTVWFVITDTTDIQNADALGILPAFKLEYADTGRAVRRGWIQRDGSVTFERGMVNFAPERRVVPGNEPHPFPPRVFTPGSVGDRYYSPLVRLENAGGHIYNAPIVATGEQANYKQGEVDYRKVHDKVVAISTEEQTVTLALTLGFTFGKPLLYLSTDASHELNAALEASTLAPALQDVAVGRDDSFASGIERLFAVVNGPRGRDNPQRQGFESALGDANVAGPLNVFGGVPTVALDYSPLWDMNVGVWTPQAIENGYRSRMIDEFQFLGMVQRGHITAAPGTPIPRESFGSSGFIVNCPVVHRLL